MAGRRLEFFSDADIVNQIGECLSFLMIFCLLYLQVNVNVQYSVLVDVVHLLITLKNNPEK